MTKWVISRNRLILKWVKDVPHKSNKDARRHLRKTLNRIGFGDWLLLYMIARNIDRYLYDFSHKKKTFTIFPALSSLPLPTTSILPALDITRMRSRTRTKKI